MERLGAEIAIGLEEIDVIVAALEDAEFAGCVAGVASVWRVEIGVSGNGEIGTACEGERRRYNEQESEKDCGEDASDTVGHGFNS
jgi:hypothetical protein